MNNSINKTKMQFNKVAEEYDFMESLFDNSKFFVLEMSDNKGSVLDIGCGSGILAYKLSKHYDKVIGIKIGFRIFKSNLSKDWLKHLASDRYLSEEKFKDLFTTNLPGCRISRNAYQMQVIWENKK
ncbi:class I SAM-dependent methyltransferase [Clostridium tagluense]|uniref:Uncharacterized protein n=1 Tax=Clostridium tagluense TaxID=360422 RepID=A0A401UTI6_9CLOT|nr:methyltransferase [Clostridium tagluense]GCD12824.1 hypothetical protein Ctaglu_44470 [Clostridium tagluense]